MVQIIYIYIDVFRATFFSHTQIVQADIFTVRRVEQNVRAQKCVVLLSGLPMQLRKLPRIANLLCVFTLFMCLSRVADADARAVVVHVEYS